MAKLLFIEKDLRLVKLGIMYVSAALKKAGHQTDIIQTDLEDIDEKMVSFKPDFLCYSICTGQHKHAFKTNDNLKKKYVFKSIFGGPHCTFFPEESNRPGVDFWVQGQGELSIVDIVEGKEKNKVAKKPLIAELDNIAFPDREIIYKYEKFRNNPMKNMITSRGCPYNCSYCFNHKWREMFAGCPVYQRRSVDNVIAEIKEIREKYPLEKILFNDDNFLLGDDWIAEFSEKYKKEVGLPFLCSLTVNLVTEEKIKKLKESGLEMANFAIESADYEVRKNILNKGHITNEQAINAIKIFNKYNIRIRMQNMIGLPLQNPLKDALNTLKFNLENKVTDSWVSIFQPYPRTQLAEYAIEKGFVSGDVVEKCAESYYDESKLDIPDKDKINRLQKWWYFIIEYNIPIEVAEILISLPLSQEQAKKLQDIRFDYSKKRLYAI